jgi:hypothetical protein
VPPAIAAARGGASTLAAAPHREPSPGEKSARGGMTIRCRAPPGKQLRAVAGPIGLAGPWRVHANFASCLGPRGSFIPVSPRHDLDVMLPSLHRFTGFVSAVPVRILVDDIHREIRR